MDESVLFEVADFALCLQLCNRLDQDWDAHVVGRTESHFVANLHAFTSWLNRNGNPGWMSLSATSALPLPAYCCRA